MTGSIKKYSFKSGLSQEFEIVDIADLMRQQKHMLTTPHRASFNHVLWFRKGTPTHIVDFKPVQIKPGSLLLIGKGRVQVFDKEENFEAKAILFTDDFFCRSEADTRFLRNTLLFNDLFGVVQVQLNEANPVWTTLFKLMEDELENTADNLQVEILQNHLHNLLLLAERARKQQDRTEPTKGADLDYTQLYKDLLEDLFVKLKQVGGYAKLLHITEKRLNQATTKILGESPKNMIDQRVMLEAKRLLVHTHESIKEIGFALGFEEPTNFVKYFRKHSGLTPVAFRDKFTS